MNPPLACDSRRSRYCEIADYAVSETGAATRKAAKCDQERVIDDGGSAWCGNARLARR
jgi:hypothetical protein